jgi:3D (Asp-Asp-Asp) domain-containing protein
MKNTNKRIALYACLILLIILNYMYYTYTYMNLYNYIEKSHEIVEQVPVIRVIKEVKATNDVELVDYSISEGTVREVTMYTSTPEQTDSSPCIGANTQDICVLWRNGQNICASNAFPRGTVLEVDKLGECIVIDRMNKRYSNRVDWYAGYDDDCLDGIDDGDDCPNYRRARDFGVQRLLVNKK